jgi:hypothetical protein
MWRADDRAGLASLGVEGPDGEAMTKPTADQIVAAMWRDADRYRTVADACPCRRDTMLAKALAIEDVLYKLGFKERP